MSSQGLEIWRRSIEGVEKAWKRDLLRQLDIALNFARLDQLPNSFESSVEPYEDGLVLHWIQPDGYGRSVSAVVSGSEQMPLLRTWRALWRDFPGERVRRGWSSDAIEISPQLEGFAERLNALVGQTRGTRPEDVEMKETPLSS